MTTYVALLRAINLGGRNRVAMDDLRKLFVALGHTDAKTHIQSGNVIFSAEKSAHLAADIEKRLAEDLDVKATVLLRTQDELAKVIDKNPFANRDIESDKLLVTFLADTPDRDRAAKLEAPANEPDELALVGRELYLYCPNGAGRTKLSSAFIEKRLGVASTTRNWKVVNKLRELMAG